MEQAEEYRRIMVRQGHVSTKELAEYLGQPYRTIKSVMRLLGLPEQAKKLLRDAATDPAMRPRLSRGMLESIPIRGESPRSQIAHIRQHLCIDA